MAGRRPLTLGGVNVRQLLHHYRQGLSSSQSLSLSSLSSLSSSQSLSSPIVEKGGKKKEEEDCKRPVLLVSACLLGHCVSYRRHHSSPRPRTPAGFLLHCLASDYALLTCIPVCPEMDLLHMTSPRPPIRLLQSQQTERKEREGKSQQQQQQEQKVYIYGNVKGEVKEGRELRERLISRHPLLADELLVRQLTGIDACLLKARSPSCGVGDARVYTSASGGVYKEADGFFVNEWLRPVVGTLPLVTERQLYFDDEEEEEEEQQEQEAIGISITRKSHHNSKHRYGVLSFIRDFLTRFEKRRGAQS
ncbi:uncharacterized protein TM35_000431190 [Trypanosoma theileri]|uniref:Uncharacterized protein n=1 Tax=Trypanosoma theileri TaxID=67003 RepID=A0A1X0NIY6_9TRYP|nr:uncharacterized protein TM35_000431190 [Trypanosoma theileri]ORC84551.1 hypothetical protein TM35_000431190 [Trypanosoma theileri]